MRGLRRVILAIVLALVVIGVPACDVLREAEGPTVQVLSPQNLAQVQLGESVDVVSTATDAKGVTRVELYVGEDLYRTDGSPTPDGETSWTFTQTWMPTAPGLYTLTVVAYNVDGLGSTPWAVAIEVVEGPTTGGTPVSTIPPATGTPPPPLQSTGTGSPPPPTGTALPQPPTATTPPPPTNTPLPPTPTNTPPGMADLYIAEFSIDPEEPRVGEQVQLRVVVRNGGNAPSESFGLGIGVTPRPPSLHFAGQAVSLAPGEEQVFAPSFTFSESGLATITARIGIGLAEQDSNEENNTAELVVNVLPEALPDLYIADFSINPEEPRVGEPAAIRVVVRNRGNAASGVFGFALYLVQPGPVESIQLQHDCRSLAPGEERVPVSLFAFSQSGPATLRAEVLSVPSGMTICFEELVVNVRPAS